MPVRNKQTRSYDVKVEPERCPPAANFGLVAKTLISSLTDTDFWTNDGTNCIQIEEDAAANIESGANNG